MSTHHLAPVQWQLGQTLLPKHLLAQENAITGEATLRHLTNGLPCHGVSRMCFDDSLLKDGILSVSALRLFTKKSHVLVDCPGNAVIFNEPIDLTEHPKSIVSYFILRNDAEPSEPVESPYKEQANSEIKRRLYTIVLSLNPTLTNDVYPRTDCEQLVESGKLAAFVQNKQGYWQLSDSYIPPLTQIGYTPFLKAPLNQLNTILTGYLREMQQLYQEQQLPEIRRFEIRHCLNHLSQCLQYLANHLGRAKIAGEIDFHPYFLYEQLQSLYLNLSLLESDWSVPIIHNYQHDNLHKTFMVIFTNILSRIKLRSRNNQSFKLQLKNGSYQTALPTGLSRKDNLYLIVNSEKVDTLAPEKLPCIGSYQRMPMLFQYALNGVQLLPTQYHLSTHYFGNQAQVYSLEKGEELNHIISDRSIAFLAQPEFEDFTFYLFLQPHNKTSSGASNAASE